MRAVIGAAVLGMLVGVAIAYAQSVQYKAAESYMPEVVTIKRTLPDKARLCVEPAGGGLLVCKSIGEVRAWFTATDKK